MKYFQCGTMIAVAVVSLSMVGRPASAAEKKQQCEDFDAGKFGQSTTIDNPWFPLKPGMRFAWDGWTVDEEGDEESRSVVFTVTDLTKVIGGVRTVVCLERDIIDGEMEETEILFAAQDNDGNVWLMGEYPEEYDNGELVEAPCWIHGIQDSVAGIMMLADPQLGSGTYSQGCAPAIGFTDHAFVYKTGESTKVPFGTYHDVLVIDESDLHEPNAHQLKYFARGVGNVRVGWRGEVTDKETLELVKLEEISAEELANAREEALKLERSAYEISKDVYGHTQPSERSEPAAGAQ